MIALWLLACQSQTSVLKSAKEMSVSPSFLDVGVAAVDDTLTETVKLTHLKGDAIQVVDVRLQNIDGQAFSTDESLTFTLDVNTTETLEIAYHPTDAGYHRATLTISTDEEQTPIHEVELRGAALLPLADLSPTLLDFGHVKIGNSATLTATLQNIGVVPLHLSSLSFSSPLFSSQQTETTIDPGANLDIDVRFTAADLSPANSTLSLDLGPTQLSPLQLRANDCEHGDASAYDQDRDGYTTCGGDCDDSDANTHPGQVETCDSVDNNCDGLLNENTVCADDDGDGYTEQDGDCNDGDVSVHPGAREDPRNGIDDDCDGTTDKGDQDLDGDGYSISAGDCDDADASLSPAATEKADAVDNNCNGITDEGTAVYDDDGDGYNERAGDCNDADATIAPNASEVADRIDNNCDGQVDEGTSAGDDDGDGFTEDGGDCDDGNSAISPAILEVAGDGIDNDCDGVAD